MIWVITKRQIVYRLHKKRWQKGLFWADSLDRQNRGIQEDEFKKNLFADEFGGKGIFYYLKKLYVKIRPHYLKSFNQEIGDVIDQCIEDDYLKRVNGTNGLSTPDRLIVKSRGRDFIRWFYFPKVFFANAYVKAVLISILVLFVTNYITENIINKVSNKIISNEQKISP